jgi:hypothetical protein
MEERFLSPLGLQGKLFAVPKRDGCDALHSGSCFMASDRSKRDRATELSTDHPVQAVGHVYLDAKRRQLYCLNPRARQLYATGVPFTPTDLKNHPLNTLTGEPVGPDDLPLIRAWREGRAVEDTFVLPQPRSDMHQISWTASPVWNREKKIIGIVGTVSGTIPEPDWQALAGLAHDLRTPLQALQLLVPLLKYHASLPTNAEEVQKRIQTSADRALEIGLQLLEWCRSPLQRTLRPEPVWFPLEPLLSSLAGEQEAAAQQKGLRLVTDLASARDLEVHTDRQRLGRLLANLLSNAVRYTQAGKVEFKAEWQSSRPEPDAFEQTPPLVPDPPERQLVLSVVDTGKGITREEQESIFQPFERGKAAHESDSGGSGLGLAVVDRLVEELGLTLELYSEFGRGSDFRLSLPSTMLRTVNVGSSAVVKEGSKA